MEYSTSSDFDQKSQFDSFELQIFNPAKGFLKETANWATFLAVIGFILVALGFLSGIFYMTMGDTVAKAGGAGAVDIAGIFPIMGAFIMGASLVFIIPLIYLLQFSSKIKSAINENSTDKLTGAFGSLKSHYKFVGIFTIIVIALYVVGIIFSVVFAVTQASGAI